MADSAGSGSRHSLSSAPPHPIPKDTSLPENSIPLSPQWLMPKSWDNKPGMIAGEPHSYPGHDQLGILNVGNGEEIPDTTKNKTVVHHAFPDTESSHHEHWRDEERDVNLSVKKDRRRDGEKDFGRTYREDRLAESSSTRKIGEGRRSTPEGRPELSYKECNFDKKREMKWGTSWGPGVKETEGLHDKRAETCKDSDIFVDRGPSSVVTQAKNDRPWKPNFSQGRGRIDPVHPNHTPNKQVSYFPYGRGRGDGSSPVTFSLGCSRTGSIGGFVGNNSKTMSFMHGSDRVDGNDSLLKYSRTKMLDLFRKLDIRLQRKMLDGFENVPSFTLEEPLEPLALCAPTLEESAVLMGIDRGDIICGGAPQISKEGPAMRNSIDFVNSLKDVTGDSAIYQDVDKGHISKSWSARGISAINDVGSPRSISAREKLHVHENGWTRGSFPNTSQISPSQPKGINRERGDYGLIGSYEQSDITNDNANFRRHFSERDRVNEKELVSQPSTDDLMFHYKDPQGDVQGPFSGRDIVSWFEAEYFGLDLQVRFANAAPNSHFYSLGDVMPHLRPKTKAPPGFGVAKAGEHGGPSSQLRLNVYGKTHNSPSEPSFVQDDDRRNIVVSSIESDNRFIESLMSGKNVPLDMLSSFQGFQGYSGSNPSIVPNLLAENVNGLHLLEKRLAFERQMSSPQMLPHLLSRESTTIDHNLKMAPPELSGQHAVRPLSDLSRSPDLVSILQGMAPRQTPDVDDGVSNRPGLSSFGSFDPHPNQLSDFNPGHHVPSLAAELGILSPRGYTQSNPLVHDMDGLNPEALHSSSLLHNPQVLALLQKQYLMQLHSQTGSLPPSQEMLVLDKLRLLKQQQKQEEMVRQQEQFLSRVLSDSQPQQSYEHHGSSAMPPAAVSVDRPQVRPQYSNEILQHPKLSNMTDEPSSSFHAAPTLQASEISFPPSSLYLPHQIECSNQKHGTAKPESNVPPMISGSLEHSRVVVSKPFDGSHNLSRSEQANSKTVMPLISFGDLNVETNKCGDDCIILNDPKSFETPDTKKSSSRKSRKGKSLKANAICGQEKGIEGASPQLLKSSIIEGSASPSESLHCFDWSASAVQEADLLKCVDGSNSQKSTSEPANFQKEVCIMQGEASTCGSSAVHEQDRPPFVQDKKALCGQRMWKHSPDVKPKSLLQIQQEEHIKAEAAATNDVVEALGFGEIDEEGNGLNLKMTEQPAIYNSLNNEVAPDSSIVFLDSSTDLAVEPDTNDNDFIDAKETKKSRKKFGKSKGNGVKILTNIAAATDAYAASNSSDNGKILCQNVQQQEDVSPSLPAGPSLGDFVFWKESENARPPPAWFTGYGKTKKQNSLREIQKEQENSTPSSQNHPIQVPGPKVESVNGLRGSVSPLSPPVSLPKVSSEMTKGANHVGEDDLFWGPIEQQQQPKHEPTQAGFPELPPKGIAMKGAASSLSSQQKRSSAAAVKPAERSLSTSPVTAQLLSGKAKKDAANKHAEAAEFRRWCESESGRLTGSNDTGFLEFCAKQGRAEAEILLVENIGARDPNRNFIDRFLDYTELLPSDVIELAFNVGDIDVPIGIPGAAAEQERRGKGKRKGGRKGKKVNPAVLGFSVVSNRIMMGEIQTVEE